MVRDLDGYIQTDDDNQKPPEYLNGQWNFCSGWQFLENLFTQNTKKQMLILKKNLKVVQARCE
jgi:hypothetical protein